MMLEGSNVSAAIRWVREDLDASLESVRENLEAFAGATSQRSNRSARNARFAPHATGTRMNNAVVNISLIRRSRGYAPEPVDMTCSVEGVFASGAELKSSFCIG